MSAFILPAGFFVLLVMISDYIIALLKRYIQMIQLLTLPLPPEASLYHLSCRLPFAGCDALSESHIRVFLLFFLIRMSPEQVHHEDFSHFLDTDFHLQ